MASYLETALTLEASHHPKEKSTKKIICGRLKNTVELR